MTVQTLRLEHVPHPHEVHVVAFNDVANGAFLRDQLLSGNPEFEYAFVDSSVVGNVVLQPSSPVNACLCR